MKTMDHGAHNDGSVTGIVLSLGTIILYVLSIFTVSEWAGIFAIGAGATAMLYNFTKWVYLLKANHKKRKK